MRCRSQPPAVPATALAWTMSLCLAVTGCRSDGGAGSTLTDPQLHKPVTYKLDRKAVPPVAKVVPHKLSVHGHERIDDYYWLRDDKRERKEVLDHLRAENAYTRQVLAATEPLQKELLEEMKARIKKDDDTVPYLEDGYWYYARYEKGKEYAIHCRRQGSMESAELVLLDENQRAAGHDYYSLGGLDVSSDNKVLAFSEDTVSRRVYTVRFKDLATGEVMGEEVPGTTGGVTWAMDGRTLFYTRREEGTLRAYQVWRHRLGTDAAEDVLVFEESDPEFHVAAWRTRSREFLVISSRQTTTGEHRVLPAKDPTATPRVFLAREKGHEYQIEHGGDRWFVRTNWQAKNFRLMSVPGDRTTDRSAWQEVIPYDKDVFLQAFAPFRDWLVVSERRGGLPGLRVLSRKDDGIGGGGGIGGEDWTLEFDEPVYGAWLGHNPEYGSGVLRYAYTSLTTPMSVYDYDLVQRQATLRKRQAVLGGFRREDYVSERVVARARDGVAVPLSLVYRKDLDRSRPQPLYLYGYGSYGHSMDPYFSSARLSLLDRGFIFAVAHVRGGQEFGRGWYEDGKLLEKQNTFTDFVDCALHLVEEGFTGSDRLVISGGSAGGLLVGAAVNMRPDLFRAVIAHVPFVDVVTTMLDESIPLTTFEYDEWGNPNDERYYRYMLSYSPYDNVRAVDYPDIFVLTGLHDSQVQYWEPAKWVARLRATKTGNGLVLLHTNMETGHGGASGRFRALEELAMEYAFLLTVGFPGKAD